VWHYTPDGRYRRKGAHDLHSTLDDDDVGQPGFFQGRHEMKPVDEPGGRPEPRPAHLRTHTPLRETLLEWRFRILYQFAQEHFAVGAVNVLTAISSISTNNTGKSSSRSM